MRVSGVGKSKTAKCQSKSSMSVVDFRTYNDFYKANGMTSTVSPARITRLLVNLALLDGRPGGDVNADLS